MVSFAATAQSPEPVAVDPSDDPNGRPLVHLTCSICEAEVWWPAELAGERRCFTCGNALRPSQGTPESSGQGPAGHEAEGRAHAVGLLRRLAEHHRRSAHEQLQGQDDAAASGAGSVLLEQARAAQRLELLASSLDRLHADDVDVLHAAVELLGELTTPGSAPDPERLRTVVERARRAVGALADVLMARDAHV